MGRVTHRHLMHRGLVPTDQLGSGTADATTFLRGDQTWDTPAGGGGGGVTLVPEVPAGTIDGVNDTFTLSVAPDLLILFKNGLLQREGTGNDYVLTGSTIVYEAGNIPQVGDSHLGYLNDSITGEILDHTTAEMDDTLVLAPDGAGGVEFRAEAGGGGGTTLDLFGDGQDGDVVVNSGAFSHSVGASALITNNALVRDAYFNDLELNGGDLIMAGFRLHVAGTLTMTSGVIRSNGGNGGVGGNGSAGAGGGVGNAGAATTVGNTVISAVGLQGSAGGFNAAGATPVANTASQINRTAQPNGATGGVSGQGQAGGQRNASASTNVLADRAYFTDMFAAIRLRNYSNTLPGWAQTVGSAVGGGGGGGAAASGGGGGGGSGASGGPVIVVVNVITGTTDIRSLGGNGGNGGNGGGTDAGGGAGGNGGGGGAIFLVYRDQSGWSGVLDVTGGTGGTGGALIGTGAVGGNGSTGNSGFTKEWAI